VHVQYRLRTALPRFSDAQGSPHRIDSRTPPKGNGAGVSDCAICDCDSGQHLVRDYPPETSAMKPATKSWISPVTGQLIEGFVMSWPRVLAAWLRSLFNQLCRELHRCERGNRLVYCAAQFGTVVWTSSWKKSKVPLRFSAILAV
jgi:hypothetical protein